MATHRVTKRRQRGFTLIEVMVAILLTALTVIGVLGLFRVETRASQFSRRETEAAVLANDKLEELRTQTTPTTGVTDYPADQLTGANVFTRSWTATVNGDMTRITVVVTWDENGITRTVTVSGLRGNS
jgi:type II secretion system protein I